MTTRAHRVLVVDDDRAIRELVKRLVARHGFVIDTANDGAEAWTLLAENAYDAVLLDLMMPNMNGFDLVDRIRCDKPSVLPRIVIMTAFSRGGKLPVVEGVHSILRKPFDISELLEQLTDVAKGNE
jgi:CheY-like chemotaxis protein